MLNGRETHMVCGRCQGLMVEDHLLDIEEAFGCLWIRGWRCVCCGDVIDRLILQRRMARRMWNQQLAEALSE